MAGKKSSKLGLRLSVSAILGLLSGGATAAAAVVDNHAPRNAPVHHRALQTGSNLLWVDPLGENPAELQVQ